MSTCEDSPLYHCLVLNVGISEVSMHNVFQQTRLLYCFGNGHPSNTRNQLIVRCYCVLVCSLQHAKVKLKSPRNNDEGRKHKSSHPNLDGQPKSGLLNAFYISYLF